LLSLSDIIRDGRLQTRLKIFTFNNAQRQEIIQINEQCALKCYLQTDAKLYNKRKDIYLQLFDNCFHSFINQLPDPYSFS